MKPITLKELAANPEFCAKMDAFKTLMSSPPVKKWVKEHHDLKDNAGNAIKYLPIEAVEGLLDMIFPVWQVEIKSVTPIFNSINVTIRLHYQHPVDMQFYFHDGVGAKELQTRKNTGTLKPTFENILYGAVERAVPIAKSQALKDAVGHIGKIFGRDLNRKLLVTINAKYNVQDEPVDIKLLEKGKAQ